VFSSTAFSNRIYSGLNVITMSGSPVDGTLAVGDRKSLLGIFSVNLRKALGAAGNADSPDNAHAVPQAVEFFAGKKRAGFVVVLVGHNPLGPAGGFYTTLFLSQIALEAGAAN
jgi:hypothetical protein